MLAIIPKTDTYLSAKQLGISERELEVLISVRNDLATGAIVHFKVPKGYINDISNFDKNSSNFNMGHWSTEINCNTVHCIGGFMEARLETNKQYGNLKFYHLFYPILNLDFDTLTAEQAVRAIDFWATGNQEDCWKLALEEQSE